MKDPDRAEATRMLSRAASGDADAEARIVSLAYERLRGLAGKYLQRERPDHTLQATALVHEAYVRLVDQRQIDWEGRTHFLGLAAREMRRVLIDHARGRGRVKRGGGEKRERILLEDVALLTATPEADLLDLAEALDELAETDERLARVVELRFFGGLNREETGAVLAISPETVKKDMRLARAWLHRRLKGDETD